LDIRKAPDHRTEKLEDTFLVLLSDSIHYYLFCCLVLGSLKKRTTLFFKKIMKLSILRTSIVCLLTFHCFFLKFLAASCPRYKLEIEKTFLWQIIKQLLCLMPLSLMGEKFSVPIGIISWQY
jgi:hypothetical protein